MTIESCYINWRTDSHFALSFFKLNAEKLLIGYLICERFIESLKSVIQHVIVYGVAIDNLVWSMCLTD